MTPYSKVIDSQFYLFNGILCEIVSIFKGMAVVHDEINRGIR